MHDRDLAWRRLYILRLNMDVTPRESVSQLSSDDTLPCTLTQKALSTSQSRAMALARASSRCGEMPAAPQSMQHDDFLV